MKIEIVVPRDEVNEMQKWSAEYQVRGTRDVTLVDIESRSSFQVMVVRVWVDWLVDDGVEPYNRYCICVPAFRVVLDGYGDLMQTGHMTASMVEQGMPQVDALTVAQVLRHISAAHLV